MLKPILGLYAVSIVVNLVFAIHDPDWWSLANIAVILFIIGMGVFLWRFNQAHQVRMAKLEALRREIEEHTWKNYFLHELKKIERERESDEKGTHNGG